VLVQTAAPGRAAIDAAARHDADGFVRGELERRRALCYPPFADLIRVVVLRRGGDAAPRAAADAVAGRDGRPGRRRPRPAPLFRLRDRERFQVVVKARERAPAVAAGRRGRAARANAKAFARVTFSVDVDPQYPRAIGARITRTLAMADEPAPESRRGSLTPASTPRSARARDAALKLVRKFGDPVLSSRAARVERFDARCARRSRRMGS
jgi:hypothetical protein